MRKLLRKMLPKKVRKSIKKILGKEKLEDTKKEEIKETSKSSRKKINIFVEMPSLTIKQICTLSGIEVPKEYERQENLLIGTYGEKRLIVLERKSVRYKSKLKKELKMFVEKYYTQECLEKSETDLLGYIIDWLYHYGSKGFTYNDYFDYEIYNKTEEETDKFLNGRYRNLVNKLCNKKEDKILLKNKAQFNTKYQKYVKREWLDTTTCTYEQFEEFVKKYPKHFAKPVTGTGGNGAGILKIDEKDNLNELFDEYKKKEFIIEDVVKQHNELAKFNESSLNTIRVYTLLCADGKARVLLAIIRFGRKGNTVDNFHSGGVTAVVDVEKGIVSTDALNRAHVKCTNHPDSGLPIKGFKIPCWDKIVEATTDAAKIIPTLRHIGWDVALKEDGNVELIEGNSWPNFDATQAPDQIGKKYCYEKYINELKEMKEKESNN